MITMTSAAEPIAVAVAAPTVRARRHAVAVTNAAALLIPVLITVALVLHVHSGGSDLTEWWLGDVANSAVLLIPGLLVARKRPENAIGWLVLWASASTALSDAGREYLVFGFLGGTAPGWLWIGWFTDSIYKLSVGALPLILMLFPDGRAMSRRARWLLALPIAAILTEVLGSLFYKGDPVDIQGNSLANPTDGVLPRWLPELLVNAGNLLFIASVIAAIGVLVARYRRSSGELRLQMKWVVWAGAFVVIELASEMLPGNPVATITGPVATGLLTAAIGIAILRHRLFDIDVVINRTLVFAALTLLVGGFYLAMVAAIDAAFGQPTHLGPGLVATALAAVAFAPARSRVQRAVDRLMYGERKSPYRVMTQLSRRLESDGDCGELSVVVDTVTQALKLPYAAIFDASGKVLADTGTAGPALVPLPLNYQGAGEGQLLVSPRPGTARFSRDEQRLLDDLARQIGAAVHAVRLSGALQASRERLVSAKEEERLRLRRDLHDGLGPKLAALGLKTDAARGMVDTHPERARQLLGTITGDLRGTIEDVRRLVYGLRPPALDELGLVGALRECAQRFDTPDTPSVSVRAGDLPPLPAAVEVAVYWIVNEAVTNVVRHAAARTCTVTLDVDDGAVRLTVADDGRGLPDGWRAGVGTSSMAERAGELGGDLRVTCGRRTAARRGTEVTARIPLR